MAEQKTRKQYWQRNLKYLITLPGIWFIVSFGFSIVLVDYLDGIRIGEFKLGFWFAHQGSIYVFVILIFVYVYLMNRLDILVNNAAQTVRRPPGYYAHLIANEKLSSNELPQGDPCSAERL